MQKIRDSWPSRKLGEVAKIQSGGTPSRRIAEYWRNGTIPWVTTSEVNGLVITSTREAITDRGLAESSAKLFPIGTILLALYGQGKTRGQVGLLGVAASTNQACAAISPTKELDTQFLFQFLQFSYERIRNLSNAGGQKNLTSVLVAQVGVPIPPLPEQRKIAEILGAWDDAIEKLMALRAAKGLRRNWIRAELLTGKRRLAGFSDAWPEVRLSDVLTEHKARSSGEEEVFSVSVHKGLVNQIDHLGRSFAAQTTSHYNRVLPGDIVYTKSPTGDFPLGIIKQSTLTHPVIVSPLYGVFSPATHDLGVILGAHFESPVAVRNYLSPLVQKGAKNTIAITNQRFLEGRMKLPLDPTEQSVTARLFETDRLELTGIDAELTALRQQKRGLMQKLLTGQWRVEGEATP